MTSDSPSRTVKSVERAFELLETIWQSNGSTLGELSDAVGLSPGTVHTHLATLKKQGYVQQNGRTYELSLQFVTVGEFVRNRNPLYRAGREEAVELAQRTGEMTHLITECNGREVILFEEFGANAVGIEFYIENREEKNLHLHYSAAGKALLAHLDESRVEQILDEYGLPARTENTITDYARLMDELEQVRREGYAVNDEEGVLGLRAVGAPILYEGEPLGAISVSGPTTRLSDEKFTEEMPATVKESANIIEINIQTDDRLL